MESTAHHGHNGSSDNDIRSTKCRYLIVDLKINNNVNLLYPKLSAELSENEDPV